MLRDEHIRTGTVVSHLQLGSGQIVDVDEDGDEVMINFVSDTGRLMSRDNAKKSLSRLRDEGLEARLVLAPEETRQWVEEAPLQLVAAALLDVGRRTKTSDLKDKLSPAVVSIDSWRVWWTRVQNALKTSPQFDYDSKNGTRLRVPATKVDSVSFGELPSPSKSTQADRKKTNAATRLADWVTWMQADEAGPMPTGTSGPPDALIPVIENMPAAITPKVVERLVGAIEERIVSANRPPKSTSMFLDTLVAGLYRWSELHNSSEMPVLKITTLAARLLEASDNDEHESFVNWLADYSSKSSDNASMAADAMLHASRKAPDGTQRLLSRVHNLLDEAAQIAFWQQLLASSPGQAVRSPVEQWLRTLTPEERCTVVSSLLVTARDDSSGLGIDSLLRMEWKLANTKQRHRLFDAIALNWLLYARLLPNTETIVREVAESLNNDSREHVGSLISNPWSNMIQSAARLEIEQVRQDKDRQIADLRVQLRDTKVDLERTATQKRYVQGELHNASRVAVLDITRDAIIVLGDALQGLAASMIPPSREVSDVKDKITLSLSTLGTEPFGEVGQVVPFEPGLHEVHPPPAAGVPVRITAPGMRFFKGMDSPLIMIRMQAQIQE